MSIPTSCVSTALLIIIITCLHTLNATAVLALGETSNNWEKAYRNAFAYVYVSPLSLHAHVSVHLRYLAHLYVRTRVFCMHTYTLCATY